MCASITNCGLRRYVELAEGVSFRFGDGCASYTTKRDRVKQAAEHLRRNCRRFCWEREHSMSMCSMLPRALQQTLTSDPRGLPAVLMLMR